MAARTKKAAAKKPAKKAAPKKVAAKKPAKKAAPKKAAAKKPAKKAAPKKVAAKKPAPKKAAPKKAAAKQAPKAKASLKATPKRPEAPAPAPAPVPAPVAMEAAPSPAPAPAPEPAAEVPAGPFITTADGGHHVAPPVRTEVEPEIPAEMPKPGTDAPAFSLQADDDQLVSLEGLRGKKIVLYFYPRDNTPGCTLEAQDFSQLLPEFEAKNAVVLGVSTDNLASHKKFKKTCELEVKLLADPEKQAHGAYGAWREKNMYGKLVMGTQRSTFLIDEAGKVVRVWPKVRAENHALDVLNAIK